MIKIFLAVRPYAKSLIESLKNTKLNAPVTAFAGDQDEIVPAATVKDWQQYDTGHEFEFKVFNGGHMFISKYIKDIVDLINRKARETILKISGKKSA